MVPCKLDEEAHFLFYYPAAWNVDVKAGTMATILAHEDESPQLGRERVSWKEP